MIAVLLTILIGVVVYVQLSIGDYKVNLSEFLKEYFHIDRFSNSEVVRLVNEVNDSEVLYQTKTGRLYIITEEAKGHKTATFVSRQVVNACIRGDYSGIRFMRHSVSVYVKGDFVPVSLVGLPILQRA